MQGSLYPDGANVDHVALRRTETTKSAEILRNRLNWTSRGMYAGGEITVNTSGSPPYLHIDVAQLSGFAPNGEYIQTASDYYDIPLDDETSGVVNLVCAVYTEDYIHRQPHESDGETYPTHTEMAWRIRVYSEANYAALPATDANLANDAKDRMLVIGKVTANGPSTSLTASSIQGPTSFNNILYAEPREFASIPGISIIGVSSDTPVGDGTLDYTYSVGPIYDFTWTTTNGVGATLSPTVDGIYNLTDGAGAYLRVQIVVSMLPITGTFPISETVTIYNLYYQDIPRLTAEDELHRHFLGTGIPTPTNPHGLSLNDILEQEFTLLEEHQDIEHCNGIWKGSSAGIFQTSVTNTSPADILHVTAPISGDLYYVNGRKLDSIDVTDITFATPPAQTTYMYEVYVSDEGSLQYVRKVSYPAPRTVKGTWIIDMSHDYPFGSAVLDLQVTNTPSLRYIFSWDGGAQVTLLSTDPSQVIRLYAADGSHWVDVYVNMNTGTGDENLPGLGSYSDNITIAASLDFDQHIQIASTPYWYDAVSATWVMGYPPTSSSRFTVDKRPWGTLCMENMADCALEQMVWDPNNELGRSGILLRRNGYNNEFRLDYTGSGLAADMNGGSYYCRGKRLTVDSISNLAFSTNSTSLVWADFEGGVHVLNVTSVFAGNLTNAMHYILGSMVDVPTATSIYHYSDQIDAPERGVILWYVETDSSNISYHCDFAQNVNQVLHPWSVSSRTAGFYRAQAAYDSLFTAFEYAKVSAQRIPARDAAVIIYVTGMCVIDRAITQPSNVNVVGTRGASTTFARIEVTHVDVAGAWKLSAGCQVIGLTLDMYADGGSIFATHNNVIVERCNYTAIGTSSDAMFALDNGERTIVGVRIRDNLIATYGGMFLNVNPIADGYIDWEIVGNNIVVGANSAHPAINLDSASAIHLKRNNIYVLNAGTNNNPGIYVDSTGSYQTREIFVEDNVIKVDCTNTSTTPTCIHLHDVLYSTVNGNTMEPRSIPGTNLLIGVFLWNGGNVAICDNKFNVLGVGVYIASSFYDVEVFNNKFIGCLHRGIWVDVLSYPFANSVYGLRIEENDMNVFIKGAVGGSGWDGQLKGVDIDLTSLDDADSAVTDISISRNTFFGFLNSTGNIRAIQVQIDCNSNTIQRNFKIDDNMMSGLSAPSGSLRGIFVNASSASQAAYPISTMSISGNHIYAEVDTLTARIAGIDLPHDTATSVVEGNKIRITSTNPASNGTGIYVGQGTDSAASSGLLIANNSITAIRSGIYANVIASSINDNRVYSLGEGIFIEGIEPSPDTESRIECDGNNVTVLGYNDNPYSGVGGGGGSHCIVTKTRMRRFSITNNICHLEGWLSQFLPGSRGLWSGSSCIKTRDTSGFLIEGNHTYIDADDVEGTDGSGTARAHHIYVRAGAGLVYHRTDGTIQGNHIDNYKAASTPSVCYGIYIVPDSGFSHAAGDRALVSVVGNTIISSTFETVLAFNADADALQPPGTTISRPFEIYVPDFGVGSGTVSSSVWFGGNALMVPDDDSGRPRVYLWHLRIITGVCFSHYTNFAQWANYLPPPDPRVW